MAIIGFSKDALTDFVPAFNGNRNSPDPCAVKLRFVPYGKILEYRKRIEVRMHGAQPTDYQRVAREVQREQFVENVASVSGYFCGEKELKDPGEFYDNADHDLVVEIIRAMESTQKLTEGQRKNS